VIVVKIPLIISTPLSLSAIKVMLPGRGEPGKEVSSTAIPNALPQAGKGTAELCG